MHSSIEALAAEIERLPVIRRLGKVVAVRGGLISLSGLSDFARLGDELSVNGGGAEVVGFEQDLILALPFGSAEGIAVGQEVELIGPFRLRPDLRWMRRVLNARGEPLDGGFLVNGSGALPLQASPPPPSIRRALGQRLETGFDVLNTALPLVRGQRIGIFAGSGVGKSSLLGHLARNIEADIVVCALIGERGREVSEFIRDGLGDGGLARSVVIASSSDESPMQKRQAAWTAMTVAEWLRDQGKQVVLLFDSLTRFAEAHREVALQAGEPPSLRAYPPSTARLISALCERAGTGVGGQGDITAIFTVLVAGSDMNEPVADMARGVLDGHVVLDRAIAERGRFPAIDLRRSVSRSLPNAATTEENRMIADLRRVIAAYEEVAPMIRSGLYAAGSDPVIDRAITLWPELDSFVGNRAADGIAGSYTRLRQILSSEAGEDQPGHGA